MTSVKYQRLISAIKAHYAAKEKAKAAELNVTECCANVPLLKSLVEGTSTIECEQRDVEADLEDLETTFIDSLGVVPPFNLSDVTFTPYPELGGSDIEHVIPEDVDEFGLNVGLVTGTSSLYPRNSPAGAKIAITSDEQAGTTSRPD